MTGIRFQAAARRFLKSARFPAAAAMLLGALIAAQGARRLGVGRRERAVLKTFALKSAAAPERANGKSVEDFDRPIMENGMIGLVMPQPMQLQGIMGSEALFGPSPEAAQPMKVGDSLPDGRKIVEIGTDNVVLEKDGHRETLIVFPQLQQQPAPGPGGPPPGNAGFPGGPEGEAPATVPPPAVEAPAPVPRHRAGRAPVTAPPPEGETAAPAGPGGEAPALAPPEGGAETPSEPEGQAPAPVSPPPE